MTRNVSSFKNLNFETRYRKDARRHVLFQLVFNSCKIAGLNALVIHYISVASMSVHASNGCPGSNPARPAHPPPPYRGRSFGYLWPRARCRAGRRGGLAAKEEGGVFREVADD